MKTTIKLLFTFLILFMASNAFSQRYGISGGLSFTDIKFSGLDSIQGGNIYTRTGFRLGTAMELALNDALSFEPGLLICVKGFNHKENLSEGTMIEKYSLLYAEMPVYFKATVEWGNFKIFGLIGPYAGYGVVGKTKIDYQGQSEINEIVWGNDPATQLFQRLDYGFGVGAGMEVNKASFRITYSQGLMDITPNSQSEMNNRMLAFSFVYFFKNYYHHKYKY